MTVKLTEELKKAVEHCVWFESPEKAIQDVVRLAAYILTCGTTEDTYALRNQIDNETLIECLDKALAGYLRKTIMGLLESCCRSI